MSQFPIPRGTARALRRRNLAPSIGFIPFTDEQAESDELDSFRRKDEQRYRDLREEGYSRDQALLMSGLADPDSL